MKIPRFPIEKWNCFDGILEYQNTTNNSVEAFNNVITIRSANCNHPGLFPFIEILKKEQKMSEMKIARVMYGEPVPRKNKSEQTSARMLKLIKRYDSGKIMAHLNGVAMNVHHFDS